MSYPNPKGSIVVTDGTGKVTAIDAGSNNKTLIADSTQATGLKYVNLFNTTNTVFVDKSGSDSTGIRNGLPFLTITAALVVAQSGDVVIVNPGTYDEIISIPAGVNVRGLSPTNTIISKSASIDTDLVTLSTNCLLENVTLNLTATTHITLRGIVFATTSATNSYVSNCVLTVDNSTADVGTSNIYGIYCGGTGVASNYFNNLDKVTVNVISVSSGVKRALLMDTSTNTINCKNCNFRTSGGTDSIGAETNNAGSTLTIRTSYCEGTTADISQTLGTINMSQTKLQNSNANGKSFTTIDVFPNTMQYSLSGSVTGGATRYMRISDATTSNEMKQKLYQKCLIKNMYIRCRVAPGGVVVDTFTVRKNGVDTSVAVSVTGTATTSSLTNTSVTFAAGDDLSIKLVTGSGSNQNDIVVTIEIY